MSGSLPVGRTGCATLPREPVAVPAAHHASSGPAADPWELRRRGTGRFPSIGAVDAEFAVRFAQEWEEAWNSHDLERILSKYTDDVVFQSPYIVHRFQDPLGEVSGKDALRHYWGSGLSQQSDLRFTVEDVRVSVDTLVVNYRNQHGHSVSEVLRFRDGLVSWGCGAYVPGDSLAATPSLES